MRSIKNPIIQYVSIVALVLLVYQNCAPVHEGQVNLLSLGCESNVKPVFQNEIHPLLNRNCMGCHSSAGTQSPHSDSDVNIAFDNFFSGGTPKYSTMKTRIEENHEAGNWSDPEADLKAAFADTQDAWSAAMTEYFQCSLGGGGGSKTSAKSITDVEADCLSGGGPSTTLEWSLDGEDLPTGQKIAGSTFSVRVCKTLEGDSTSDSYQVWNPTFSTGTQQIEVKNITIFLNGFPVSTSWSDVDDTVPAGETDYDLGSAASTINLEDTGFSDADALSIGFETLAAPVD